MEWFGTTTFRVHTGGPVLFFDAYVDRVPGLDPVDQSAQMGFSVRETDSIHFTLMTK